MPSGRRYIWSPSASRHRSSRHRSIRQYGWSPVCGAFSIARATAFLGRKRPTSGYKGAPDFVLALKTQRSVGGLISNGMPSYQCLSDALSFGRGNDQGYTFIARKESRESSRMQKLSLLSVTHSTPSLRATRFSIFDDFLYARERWMIDNAAVLRMSPDPRVKLVKCEQLVDDAQTAFKAVCQFANLRYAPSILASGGTPFSLYSSPENQTIRTAQVAHPIERRIAVWSESVSCQQARSLLPLTRARVMRLRLYAQRAAFSPHKPPVTDAMTVSVLLAPHDQCRHAAERQQ